MSERGLVFWFTGLSGAGKSTVAQLSKTRLCECGISTLVLDGDDLRAAISRDLGFDRESVRENNRRVATYCAERRWDANAVLVPIISPFESDRAMVREILEPGFFEIWLAADIKAVVTRDPKGLYAKARSGEITNMIGYAPDYPYEAPKRADLVIQSDQEEPEVSAGKLTAFILERCKT
ncbi:MAG: adenylyl-sulfate kinase [Alphaproteobacteria bacterium]|nr:adenylyl-sulfate kinase [Alphaproteobacteria bacterium]